MFLDPGVKTLICFYWHWLFSSYRGCSAKRQKMMDEGESYALEDTSSRPQPGWMAECVTGSPTVQHCASAIPPSTNSQYNQERSPAARAETEGSCMEVEAAQRKLQEIENRWGHIHLIRVQHLLVSVYSHHFSLLDHSKNKKRPGQFPVARFTWYDLGRWEKQVENGKPEMDKSSAQDFCAYTIRFFYLLIPREDK